MKKYTLLTLIFLVLSCRNDTSFEYTTTKYTNKDCTDCPHIAISLPESTRNSKIGKAVNTALQEKTVSILEFDDRSEARSIAAAIQSFNREYKELASKFPSERNNWEAVIEGNVSFDHQAILSIQLNSYTFTGGAHGYQSREYLNFDKKQGKEIEIEDLFTDVQKFTEYAENQFRVKEKIPKDQDINATGFMFANDVFHLPESIGYTENGLLLIYNQYEIASYADGPITLLFPYADVNPYLIYTIE